jgi:hypothetical protein
MHLNHRRLAPPVQHRLNRYLQRLPRLVHLALPLPLFTLPLLLLLAAAASRLGLRLLRRLCKRQHRQHCILHHTAVAIAC